MQKLYIRNEHEHVVRVSKKCCTNCFFEMVGGFMALHMMCVLRFVYHHLSANMGGIDRRVGFWIELILNEGQKNGICFGDVQNMSWEVRVTNDQRVRNVDVFLRVLWCLIYV